MYLPLTLPSFYSVSEPRQIGGVLVKTKEASPAKSTYIYVPLFPLHNPCRIAPKRGGYSIRENSKSLETTAHPRQTDQIYMNLDSCGMLLCSNKRCRFRIVHVQYPLVCMTCAYSCMNNILPVYLYVGYNANVADTEPKVPAVGERSPLVQSLQAQSVYEDCRQTPIYCCRNTWL